MLISRAMLIVVFCVTTHATLAATLNDTGITFCGDNTTNTADCAVVGADTGTHPRQDAMYGRDYQAANYALSKRGSGNGGFDFTKIGNNGQELTVWATLGTAPTDWACTRDNVTGLIWEVKTNTTPRGLRDMSHTYSWYNSDPMTSGRSSGTPTGGATCFTTGRCDTEKYTEDVNGAGLCGFSTGWRMPTIKELKSIVDFGRFNPAIDNTTYFPNSPAAGFWSGTPYMGGADHLVWLIDFVNGNAGANWPHIPYGVRLVHPAP